MFFAKFFLFMVLTAVLSLLDNIMFSAASDTFRISLELTLGIVFGLIIAAISIWTRNATLGKYYRSKPGDSTPASTEQLAEIESGFKSIGRFYDTTAKLTSAQANEILAEIKHQKQRKT